LAPIFIQSGMIIFYNLGIRLYWLFISFASLFNEKARLWINGRKNIFSRIESEVEKNSNIVWFHAASLGEFEQGRPLMEAYRKRNPDTKILLTFFSPSGYEIRKNYNGADYIYYLPLDTPRNAKRFISLVNPSMVIFIKYEFWYHYLNQIKKNNIKLYLVCGIFREDQVFFKSYGNWYRKILTFFTHLFIQDLESIDLLKSININNVSFAGDTRFDRVAQIATVSKDIETALKFSNNKFCFVFGSTWPQDEEILAKYINSSPENYGFIIAPHEIHQSHIAELIQKLTVPYTLYSTAENTDLSKSKVLIIDNIGMLSSLYKYGKVAYIGGGFGAGIHNILEAAVYGMPVVFGPKFQKFREAKELIQFQAANSVISYEQLNAIFDNYAKKPELLAVASNAAKTYISKNLGATDIILNFLKIN
jgi:3-deoxy-D-manno-octulosonic-acid transferase